ncbi:MAG: rhodanese-like domain-containing protein [Parachlamydiaceae bacterium]|nr:rhodanese-like domain-containing protein [Parachlamydiaceae bacterium]
MKNVICSLASTFLCFTAFMDAATVEGDRFKQSEKAVKLATYGHVDAKGLKSLLDSHVPLTLLDARGNNWNDGNIIPGAQLASHEFSPEELDQIIPNFDSLVVIYCYSFTCPLTPWLAAKLVKLGYTNIIEYPGGLTEWRDIAKYPVKAIYR